MDEIEIRILASVRECFEMEGVQEQVWDRSVVMPAVHLFSSIGAGGIALGAYDGALPVGFCWGFPAVRDGRTWFYSHMLGVIPPYRTRGLGVRLKMSQREAALDAGYDLITWTFDPLRVGNAVLNIERLGAVATRYIRDCYGQLADPLNRDLPTDRLLIHWHLRSARVRDRLKGKAPRKLLHGTPVVNAVQPVPGEFPRSGEPDLGLAPTRLAITVPPDLDRIKSSDPELARDWRLKTRQAFEHYLGAGYTVTGIAPGGNAATYLLKAGYSHED